MSRMSNSIKNDLVFIRPNSSENIHPKPFCRPLYLESKSTVIWFSSSAPFKLQSQMFVYRDFVAWKVGRQKSATVS